MVGIGERRHSTTIRTSRALSRGAVEGFIWGVVARLWMRLIADSPEFSWGGTLYIVGAATVFGLASGVVTASRRNGWRSGARTLASGFGGGSVILLGVGAGAITLPTIVFGGLALGRSTFNLPIRVLLVLSLALLGGVAGTSADSNVLIGLAAITAVGVALLVGYRTRVILGLVALAPPVFVIIGLLFEDGLPVWQRLGGAAVYIPLLLPLTIWFSRAVAPIRSEQPDSST